MSDRSGPFAFTTSMRTCHGRLLVHITWEAIDKLRAGASATDLAVLAQNIGCLKTVAAELARRRGVPEVQVEASDIWWTEAKT